MARTVVKRGAALAACGLGLAACQKPAATGQVLATVGGKELTLQDVRAEGRANGVPASAGRAADVALLQRVVERTLLAQSAHDQKLDQTPDSPSDLARLEQVWSADKAVRRALVALEPPTDQEAQRFITDHPYAFAKRQRISARTITVAASPDLYDQLKASSDYEAALALLKRRGVAFHLGASRIDTAQVSPQVAEQLATTPAGTLLLSTPPERIQLAEIQARAPVETSPPEQLEEAKRAVVKVAAAKRVVEEVNRLKARTRIIIQAGYAPSPAPRVP